MPFDTVVVDAVNCSVGPHFTGRLNSARPVASPGRERYSLRHVFSERSSFMSRLPILSLIILLVAVPLFSEPAVAQEKETYQLMKATENTVWRLNKFTGEIAVCTLNGTNLVCTTTAEALSPKEAEEKRKMEEAARKAAERERRQRELAMLDRIIQFIRDLIGMAAESEQ